MPLLSLLTPVACGVCVQVKAVSSDRLILQLLGVHYCLQQQWKDQNFSSFLCVFDSFHCYFCVNFFFFFFSILDVLLSLSASLRRVSNQLRNLKLCSNSGRWCALAMSPHSGREPWSVDTVQHLRAKPVGLGQHPFSVQIQNSTTLFPLAPLNCILNGNLPVSPSHDRTIQEVVLQSSKLVGAIFGQPCIS